MRGQAYQGLQRVVAACRCTDDLEQADDAENTGDGIAPRRVRQPGGRPITATAALVVDRPVERPRAIVSAAAPNASRPQQAKAIGAGMTGCTVHSATPTSSTPKAILTSTIQAPARGNNAPAEAPTSNSGTLMPAASEKSAVPPSQTSRVWLR